MKQSTLHTLLAGLTILMVSSASATSITDTVEPGDGWTQIQPANSFNSFTASSGGLTPQSGTNFWKSGFPNSNNFGTYKEFDATFTAGVLRVTYSIGDLDSNTWPGEIGSRLFIASDGEGNFGSTWLNRVETPVANRNRPTPGDGEWVTCTDTYYITSDTEDAAGNPVIGEKIGFVVIKKLSGGTGGQAFAFDNLTIETVVGPVSLLLDPSDALDFSLSGASVYTGTVAVSYLEGPAATNVTITSVSVEDQTHAGAFKNLTSTPLVLSEPSPASEDLLVEFDNTIAGLTAGQSATSSLQIVWNEVGEAGSYTSSLPVRAFGPEPATLARVPGGDYRPWVGIGVTGPDTIGSEAIDLVFSKGGLDTNVVITGVSVSNTTHAGAWSASGSFPVTLSTPDVTNSSVFSLEFDNTVANLSAGGTAEAAVTVEWYEIGGGSNTLDFLARAIRPADVPTNGIIALFDTEFLAPDAAYVGILGRFTEGTGIEFGNKGSLDGDYGSLAAPPAPTNNATWRFLGNDPVTTLTITNQTSAAIELTGFHFDIGRWFNGATNFTLAISGDVTADPALLEGSLTNLGFQNNDLDDYDIDLTGLADHTLAGGESVSFTFTLGFVAEGDRQNGTWIDNVALLGTVDQYGGWATAQGLTPGVNDGPGDNPDGDSRDNLMEYATGGNPLTADGPAAAIWQAEEGGTNWLYHVHDERQDDASLSYVVGTKGNLQFDPSWDSGDVEPVGATPGAGLWKSVTNRTGMVPDEKFIGLEVERN